MATRGLLLAGLLLCLLAATRQAGARLLLDLNEPLGSTGEPLDLNVAPPTEDGHAQRPQGWLELWRGRAQTSLMQTVRKLPHYFNFHNFLPQFQRQYQPAEFARRQAIFVAHCLEVFKQRVAYRLGRSSYSATVNKFADRTPGELRQAYMSAPPIEFRPAGMSESEYYALVEREQAQRREQRLAELETDSRASLADLAGHAGDHAPRRRLPSAEEEARRRLAGLLADSAHDRDLELALQDELAELPSEVMSQASLSHQPGHAPAWPWTAERAREPDHIPVGVDPNWRLPEPESVARQAVDWSRHECFHTVYDQGEDCGKCYVMATTSLVEFYKCAEEVGVANRRKFSSAYVLDCGKLASPANKGCWGGSILETLRFLAQAGIFNIRGWRDRKARETMEAHQRGDFLAGNRLSCPLNKYLKPYSQWGDIPVPLEPLPVAPGEGWARALRSGPLAVSVQMPGAGIKFYWTGVHPGGDCERTGNWHAMLLVGMGVDERTGTPYWLLRNSWGPDWGERGHLRLSMHAPRGCLMGGVRVRPTG